MSADGDILIRVEQLSKRYRSGADELVIFAGLDFDVRRGERLAIIGESGAERARSSICWALWTGLREVRYTLTIRISPGSPTPNSLLFAIGRSVLCGKIILCCRSSRRSRMS